ncbi:MAG: bifunctional DNA-formamidopyrimidine glycosylase/DNA-(apurinic or apyrimidinic site) lyase [archaeon]|nr:bifunctional DNA-formamidopyrimidine glycosylase/DNA-(apurinic or apyrimidinic site) lyase [archaeon]
MNLPELPEIETVRRVVGPQVTGCRIIGIEMNRDKIIGHPDPTGYIAGITGRTIVSADRRGKGLIFRLDDRGRFIIRFGMTGQLIVVPWDFPAEKHTHIVFRLEDGRQMWYIDTRVFGKSWYVPADEEDTHSGLEDLGLEPFDSRLTGPYLKGRLGHRGVTIKEALLDQSVVTGLGNIWSDELLFRGRICPETPCRELSDARWRTIAGLIPEVMEFGIEKNAITPEEYLEGKGRNYYDIDYLEAYGHEGRPCPRCGTPFRRSVIGGRSSCWCPRCQRHR